MCGLLFSLAAALALAGGGPAAAAAADRPIIPSSRATTASRARCRRARAAPGYDLASGLAVPRFRDIALALEP